LILRPFVGLGLLLVLACNGSDGMGPTSVSSDLSTMNVGEVRVFTPNQLDGGLRLPESSSPGEYIIVVANTGSQHDVVANHVVNADVSGPGMLATSAPSELNGQSTLMLSHVDVARTRQDAFDNKVRAFERSGLTLHSPSGPFPAPKFSFRRSAQVAATPVPSVGDIINLKIPSASSDNLCNNFVNTQATVASVSRRAILAVDTLDGPPQLLFTQAVLDSITVEFDNITYPTDSSYFKNPTDIDSNGRIILLFTGQINKLTTPGDQGGYIAGFFFAGDFFPTTGTTPNTFCPESNQAEVFYLLAPDPTGRFGNVRSTSSVRQATRGTVAHEFQHMINAGNRYLDPAVTEFESTWLDEALAHVAEDAVGRVQRSFTDLQTLTLNDLRPCSGCSQSDDFNAFFFQNFARLTYWMVDPNQFSPMSKMADTSLATRGAAWAFLRYAVDNYSNGDPRSLTRALAAGPDTGVVNFTGATRVPVDTLVKDWLVSMYADHSGIAGLDPKYQYRSYDFPSVMPTVSATVLNRPTATYPLEVISIGTGVSISSTNLSGTGTYYKVSVTAGGSARRIMIQNPTPYAVLNCCIGKDAEWRSRLAYPGAHIYVLRSQ